MRLTRSWRGAPFFGREEGPRQRKAGTDTHRDAQREAKPRDETSNGRPATMATHSARIGAKRPRGHARMRADAEPTLPGEEEAA